MMISINAKKLLVLIVIAFIAIILYILLVGIPKKCPIEKTLPDGRKVIELCPVS